VRNLIEGIEGIRDKKHYKSRNYPEVCEVFVVLGVGARGVGVVSDVMCYLFNWLADNIYLFCSVFYFYVCVRYWGYAVGFFFFCVVLGVWGKLGCFFFFFFLHGIGGMCGKFSDFFLFLCGIGGLCIRGIHGMKRHL
jgi:hypothetical protein